MKQFTFIANPSAGQGLGSRVAKMLRTELDRAGISYDLHETSKAGDATEMARHASSDVVVAVGGDGTANEVANGLVDSGRTLGLVPAGSGNDFVKSIGIPSKAQCALKKVLEGKSKLIDVATVSCSVDDHESRGGRSSTPRYFLNGVGIGFDAAVAERTSHSTRLNGTARYVAAVFQTLGNFKAPSFSIRLDSRLMEEKRLLLVAIGNGKCAGGGFWLTPDAEVDDGWLDVCMVEDSSTLKILQLMPKVMRGRHTANPQVVMERAKQIRVYAPESFFVHADGEIVGREVNRVDVTIRKQILSTIVG